MNDNGIPQYFRTLSKRDQDEQENLARGRAYPLPADLVQRIAAEVAATGQRREAAPAGPAVNEQAVAESLARMTPGSAPSHAAAIAPQPSAVAASLARMRSANGLRVDQPTIQK